MKKEIRIYDGSQLVYSSFYGYKDVLFRGVKVGGAYGFLKTIFTHYNPSKSDMFVVFDYDRKSSFRTKLYPSYKSHRPASDPDIYHNFRIVIEILKLTGIKIYRRKGVEADDVIGTLASRWSKKGHIVRIYSNDKDFYQLVSDKVKLVTSKKVINHLNWEEHFTVPPSQFRDLLAIAGDSSDNIQGIKGIGVVYATRILKRYGSIENAYKAMDEGCDFLPDSVVQKMQMGRADIQLYRSLTTILQDVQHLKALSHCSFRYTEIRKRIFSYRFFSLEKDLRSAYLRAGADVDKLPPLNQHFQEVQYSTDQADSFLQSSTISYWPRKNGYLIGFKEVCELNGTAANLLSKIGTFLSYKTKDDACHIRKVTGICGLRWKWHDIHLMGVILDPAKVPKSRRDFTKRFGDKNRPYDKLPVMHNLERKLKDKNLYDLYTIEIKIARLLFKMESEGVRINTSYFRNLRSDLEGKISLIKEGLKATEEIGDANPLSSVQLKLSLEPWFGELPNVRIDTLKRLKHPVADGLVQLKQCCSSLAKVTKFTNLARYSVIAPTYFHVEESFLNGGRIYSQNPCIVRSINTFGRQCFQPRKGFKLISLDLSQIELRLAAHMSQDDALLQAFTSDQDVYVKIARDILKVDGCSEDIRESVKNFTYSFMYGSRLAKAPSLKGKPHKVAYRNFSSTYGKLTSYIETFLSQSKRVKWSTLSGRATVGERDFSKMIKGSASDVMRRCMLEVDEYLQVNSLKSRIATQLNDELVMEIHVEERYHLSEIKHLMCSAVKLSTPIKCEMKNFN